MCIHAYTCECDIAMFLYIKYHFISLTVGVLITTHPQDELVNFSDNVTFTCEASGSPPINYRWLYNGNYITDDPGHIEGATTDTLMIINVRVTDWGMYSCEATNVVSSAISNNATLHGTCVSVSVCMYPCSRCVQITFEYSNNVCKT